MLGLVASLVESRDSTDIIGIILNVANFNPSIIRFSAFALNLQLAGAQVLLLVARDVGDITQDLNHVAKARTPAALNRAIAPRPARLCRRTPAAVCGLLVATMAQIGVSDVAVKVVLLIVLLAKAEGKTGILVPAENAAEATVVAGLNVIPVQNLHETAQFLEGEIHIAPVQVDIAKIFKQVSDEDNDFAEVKGHETVKRVLEITAAGGHSVVMFVFI
jgi:hypothetical protein